MTYSLPSCERCGSDDRVTEFVFFENRDNEYLCWDCRWPHIKERLGWYGDGEDEEEDDESDEEQKSGQTTLSSF